MWTPDHHVESTAQWWRRNAIRGLVRVNPVLGSPTGALETAALLDSLGPSLMPRTSVFAGLVSGVNVLGARAIASPLERAQLGLVSDEQHLGARLATRAGVGAVAVAASLLPDRDDESLWRHGIRSAGVLLRAGVIGGALHDVGQEVLRRFPIRHPIRPLVPAAIIGAGVLHWSTQRMVDHEELIEPWGIDQNISTPHALGVAGAVVATGSGAVRLHTSSRDYMVAWLGGGRGGQVVGRALNTGAWAVGATSLYAGIAALSGRRNESTEPAYRQLPTTKHVSGSIESVLPYETLGLEGRRYVTEVVTPALINEVLDEPAIAHPIRAYVGFDSRPEYPTGRAELALAELERTGAFDRSYLILANPTGTGWIDASMVEAAELLTRGDIATCAIQYARFDSFLAIQNVALGRAQFRLLLWGVAQRLAERPVERRPKVLVFGESLGAWAASDVVMYQGIGGFDHYGIDRALWVGLPAFARWSRNGMARGANDLVPDGTVGVFDRYEQLAALSEDARGRLRAVLLSHDNDPVASMNLELIIQRPHWLRGERGRGVPKEMRWRPFMTFSQTLFDAANARVTVPGDFRSYGHDYRADMAQFIGAAFHLPSVTEAQMARIEAILRQLETERAARMEADDPADAPPSPAHEEAAASLAGVPLRRHASDRWGVLRR